MDLNIYAQLLAKSLIRPVQSESDYHIAISEVGGLMHKENLTLEEEALLTLWAIVIEDYENKHYQIVPKNMSDNHLWHLSKSKLLIILFSVFH